MRLFCAVIPFFLIMPFMAQAVRAATIVDDAGRQVTVPDRPLRIVSLDDADLTVPLLELGVIPVGSQGRVGKGGRPFLRSSLTLTGLDFDNTGMVFLGVQPIDVEHVAALKPDLIVTLKARPVPPEQLQAIAPTVVIDDFARGPDGVYEMLAKLTGRTETLATLERRYEAQIVQLRKIAGDDPPRVSVISATGDKKISVERSYGSIGLVLRDAGMPVPDLTRSIADNTGAVFSPEALPEFDADIIIDTYRNDRGETAQHALDRIEAMLPGFCRFLTACMEGRYYVVPRDEAKSTTYAARMMAISAITTAISGKIPAD
jgi:iron complex transport system substrate-binding protein